VIYIVYLLAVIKTNMHSTCIEIVFIIVSLKWDQIFPNKTYRGKDPHSTGRTECKYAANFTDTRC